MDMRVTRTFRLDLTKEEFRVVSKALRGALRTQAERDAALELQKRMLRTKHDVLRQALGESQKAIDNIEAAEATETASEGAR